MATPDVQKRLEEAGFEVFDPGLGHGLIGIKKLGYAGILKALGEGRWAPVGPWGRWRKGQIWRLEDRGYQKFWWLDGQRVPALTEDLKALHRFQEEVRTLLSLPSLYNESLGTTCARSVYDRLDGRADD